MYFLNSWFRSSQIFLSVEAKYFFVSLLIQMLTVGLLYFSMLGFLFLLGRFKKEGFREGAYLKGNKLFGLFIGGGLGILLVLLFLWGTSRNAET